MADTVVHDNATLDAAWKAAAPGDTIKLAAGSYDMPVFKNRDLDPAVTLTSEDRTRPARLVGLKVANASGIIFENLELTVVGASDPYYEFRISDSADIAFKHLLVTGDAEAEPTYEKTAAAFLVQNCENLVFENNLFQYLWAALVVEKSNYVTVAANRFQFINKGAVECKENGHLEVFYNYFTNFVIAEGVHSDAIQLYTSGSAKPTHDVKINYNLFWRGAGMAAQGVLIQDEQKNMPYENLQVNFNYILGGMWNSIGMPPVTGSVHCDHNWAETWPGYDNVAGQETPFKAYLRQFGDPAQARSYTLSANKAQVYIGPDGKAIDPPPSGNKVLPWPAADNGLAGLEAWAKAYPSYVGVLDEAAQQMVGIFVPSIVGIEP